MVLYGILLLFTHKLPVQPDKESASIDSKPMFRRLLVPLLLIASSLCLGSDLPPGWTKHTANGKVYYYNRDTKQSSWEKPVQRSGPTLHSPQSIGQQRVIAASSTGTIMGIHRGGNPAPLASVLRPASQYAQHPVVSASSTNIHDAKRDYSYPRETDVTRLKAEIMQLHIELNKTTVAKTELLNKAAINEKIAESLNETLISTREECWSLSEDVKALEEDLGALDGYIDKLRESEGSLRANLTAAHTLIEDQEKRLLKLSSSNPLKSIFDFRGSSIEKSIKSLAALGKVRQKQDENNCTNTGDLSDKNIKKSKAGISRESLLKTVKLLRKKLVDSEASNKVLQDEITRHKDHFVEAEESCSRLQATNDKLESLIFERNITIENLKVQLEELHELLTNSDELLETSIADYKSKLNAAQIANAQSIQESRKALQSKESEISTLNDSREYYKGLYETTCKLYNASVQKGIDLQVQVDKLQNQIGNATSIQNNQTKRRRIFKLIFIGITAIVATIFRATSYF